MIFAYAALLISLDIEPIIPAVHKIVSGESVGCGNVGVIKMPGLMPIDKRSSGTGSKNYLFSLKKVSVRLRGVRYGYSR